MFLGFRNNVCYDRWWEARKQWAELSAQCRSLARETAAVLSGAADAPRQARIVRRLIGFNHALVARLRGGDPLTAARPGCRTPKAWRWPATATCPMPSCAP